MANAAPVSVIIVNWNTRDLLAQTLSSVMLEDDSIGLDIIVVDNASEDGSRQMVLEQFPSVRVIAQTTNIGFARANNLGAAAAVGTYLLFLNSDTVVLPGCIAKLANILDVDRSIGCVGCMHLNPDGTLQRSCDAFPSILKDAACYSELRRVNVVASLLRKRHSWWGDHDCEQKVDWVNGSCMMVRGGAFETVEGFDESYRLYAEEIDLCFRLQSNGFDTWFTPAAQIIHYGGESTKQLSCRRTLFLFESQFRFYRKHYSFAYYVLFRAVVLGLVVIRVLLILLMALIAAISGNNRLLDSEVLTQDSGSSSPREIITTWVSIVALPW